MARVILASLVTFLGVQGQDFTIDLRSWDAHPDHIPDFNATPAVACDVDSLTWTGGYGGQGGIYQEPMYVVLVHNSGTTDHDLCGTELMIRSTKNAAHTDTQHFYMAIAGFVKQENTGGVEWAPVNSLLLPHLKYWHPHISTIRISDYICGAPCRGDTEFDILPVALPTGMAYYAGGEDAETECEEGEVSDDERVSGVTARDLEPLAGIEFTEDIDEACYQFFELKGSEDEIIIVQVTHHGELNAGPYAFHVSEDQLKRLCGNGATPQYTNRVPFECRIVATETTEPEPTEEATTTTTTTEETTTTVSETTSETTAATEETTTTTAAEETTSTKEEETSTTAERELGICGATTIPVDESCTKSTFEYAESTSREDAEVCSYWPSAAGCGKEDKPCPMIAQNDVVREGDTEERAQCGDVFKITDDGRSIYGQVVIHGKENDEEWDPYFRIAGQGWENICPFSCKERPNLENNCFANESECADFGGVNPGPWSVCACAKNACIDDWGHHPLSKRNSEEAFETCEIDDCCSSCIDQPASTHRLNEGGSHVPIWILRLRYEWIRKDEGSNTIQAGAAAVAAALCAL